jgi:hypothetical protein
MCGVIFDHCGVIVDGESPNASLLVDVIRVMRGEDVAAFESFALHNCGRDRYGVAELCGIAPVLK